MTRCRREPRRPGIRTGFRPPNRAQRATGGAHTLTEHANRARRADEHRPGVDGSAPARQDSRHPRCRSSSTCPGPKRPNCCSTISNDGRTPGSTTASNTAAAGDSSSPSRASSCGTARWAASTAPAASSCCPRCPNRAPSTSNRTSTGPPRHGTARYCFRTDSSSDPTATPGAGTSRRTAVLSSAQTQRSCPIRPRPCAVPAPATGGRPGRPGRGVTRGDV